MDSIPRFLQGVFPFTGAGLTRPLPLADDAAYRVPSDRRAQLIYFRAGSSAGDLVNLVLTRDGKLLRYFPLGAHGAMHVSLAVVEDLMPDTKIEVAIAAPEGVSGTVVLDVGFVEIP